MGIKFASNQLCMCLFLCQRCWLCHSQLVFAFNQMTNCSIRLNSRSYASLPGETTSISNHFKSPCRSELPGDESRQKNTHQNFREEYYTAKFLCIVRSTQSAKHVKRNTSFFSSWDLSVAHDGMCDVEQRVNSKRHINKGKVLGSTLKISH